MHSEVRRRCLDFMERESDHFRNFVANEPFDQYIQRKRREGVHGNHAEIQAISELYNRSVEVYVPDLRLSYHDGNHYNAVIDPLVPTAGLGLGLPGLEPGLADRMQLEQAKNDSVECAMEEKMRLALEKSREVAEEEEVKAALRESELSMEDVSFVLD